MKKWISTFKFDLSIDLNVFVAGWSTKLNPSNLVEDRMKKEIVAVLVLTIGIIPLLGGDAIIVGDYLEVRTTDVYTGPCFANAEVNLTGKEAMLVWRVRQGRWNDVSLDGLSVVAVVKSAYTLGDPFALDRSSHSLILVDEKATYRQRRALLSFVRAEVPDLIQNLVKVQPTPITLNFGATRAFARLKAGDIASLETRPLNHSDHICGNETVYYPPLTDVADARPAFTLSHRFTGKGLGGTWSTYGSRGAFWGQFTR